MQGVSVRKSLLSVRKLVIASSLSLTTGFWPRNVVKRCICYQNVCPLVFSSDHVSAWFMEIFSEITEKLCIEKSSATRKRKFDFETLLGHLSNSWALVRLKPLNYNKIISDNNGRLILHYYYTVWVKRSSPPPLKLFAIFSLRLSIFPWNFAIFLPVYINTGLPILVNFS